jgi:hypothetical protein
VDVVTESLDRRGGARHPHELDVELHLKEQRIPLRATDISRHGMFLASKLLFPPLHRAVLLTVKLKSGPFETMASIVRRVEEPAQGSMLGIGLKIYCLGADARQRWDSYVNGLEQQPIDLRADLKTRTSHAAASFLVQPDDPAGLLDFFVHNVATPRTLFVSPAVRKVGAEVEFVLVHPFTHEESVHLGRVTEWNPDHPHRMGVQIAPANAAARAAFRKFLGPVRGASIITAAPTSSTEGAAVGAAAERAHWTEYALHSPKLHPLAPPLGTQRDGTDGTDEILLLDEVAASLPPQAPEELDIIEGELLQHPELEYVDKRALFDFNWNAEEK